MVKRANDGEISKTHLNNVFLTYSQFQQRYENHADHRSERNMIMLNLGRKVHAAQLHEINLRQHQESNSCKDGHANGASDLFVLEQVNARGMGITTTIYKRNAAMCSI